jgi:hypothetical protein
VTYLVRKACSWRTFSADEGASLDVADLKTADGQPLPEGVVKHLLAMRTIVPVEPTADPAPAPAE